MDSLKDDAQLILQQIFQHESNIRLRIDDIKSGTTDSAPHTFIKQIRSNLNLLRVKIKEQTLDEAQEFLRQQHMLHTEELTTLQHQLRAALNVQTEKKYV